MFQSAFVAAILVGRVLAGGLSDVAAPIITREDFMEGSIRRYVEDADTIKRDAESSIGRRQSTASPATGMTVGQWDAQTQAACTSTLAKLNGKATNDAGMAVCYNIAQWNDTDGSFKADLRLFKVSPPTGQFTNIPAQDVKINLTYVGANATLVDSAEIGRRAVLDGRSEPVSLISWPKRNIDKRQAVPAAPALQGAYAFIGQIKPELRTANSSDKDLEKLLAPTVKLIGTTAAGDKVITTLDATEASFVSGQFSVASVAVSKTAAQAPIQTLVVAPGAPFVVPGMNILIFPVGAIITGVWALLLIVTIGYGTFGRMQFRDQFRRRNAIAMKGNLARI